MSQRPYPLIGLAGFQWWKPLVGIVAVLLGMFAVVPLLLMPVVAVAVLLQGDSLGKGLSAALSGDAVTPASMLYLNLTLAALIPLTWVIVRYVHGIRPRWLASVNPGIRWRFLAGCFVVAAVAIAAQLVVGHFLPDDVDAVLGDPPEHLTGRLVALGLVILLTTPFQAIGEEYVFRGYLNQAFSSFTTAVLEALEVHPETARRIAVSVGLLLCSTLFAMAHGLQNVPLFVDRFAFGLMAGYLVLRTGGLEAGIALHVLNNLTAFGLALAFGDVQSTLRVHEVSYWQLVLTVTQDLVFLGGVLLLTRKFSLRRQTLPDATPELAT